MRTRSLFTAVEDVLQQGCTFLDTVSDEVYARPLDGPLAASLGAHYRHTLDHFLCLIEGIRIGRISYDERRRDPHVEKSVDCARRATESLMEEFRGLSAEILEQQCTVIYSVGYGEAEAEAVSSNVAREIMFCVGHTIHHYALLRILCGRIGVRVPYELGIAPSTLKHLEAQTAERA